MRTNKKTLRNVILFSLVCSKFFIKTKEVTSGVKLVTSFFFQNWQFDKLFVPLPPN